MWQRKSSQHMKSWIWSTNTLRLGDTSWIRHLLRKKKLITAWCQISQGSCWGLMFSETQAHTQPQGSLFIIPPLWPCLLALSSHVHAKAVDTDVREAKKANSHALLPLVYPKIRHKKNPWSTFVSENAKWLLIVNLDYTVEYQIINAHFGPLTRILII